MLYYSVEDSHKAERHLLVVVGNMTGNSKNLEINTLDAHHPPPTHRHHHLQTSWLRYDHRHSSSADNCARTERVRFLACVHVSAGIASLSERA